MDARYILNNKTSKDDLFEFFWEKSGNDSVKQILLYEIALYCRKNYEDDTKKTSAVIGVGFFTHMYFISSRWRTPNETYNFFKESILIHTIEYPPTSLAILRPKEARDALLFFVEIYMRNLPLIRLICLPHYKLRLKIKNNDGSSYVNVT